VIEPILRATLPLEVYVITSSGHVPGRGHREVAQAAAAGGATAVQLRAPELGDHDLLTVAGELTAHCRERGVLFIVNNRIEVALESGADGVHVGQEDHPEGARDLLGPDPVLGVSVEGAEQAREAEHLGASYVAATVWPTSTKPEAAPLGLDGLRGVCVATSLPVVGIGGITASNAGDVLAAGAAGVAVVSAVGAAADPEAATRELVDVVRAFREQG
jgi:thiamine-phosphate pyrophosphorylase